MKTNIIISHDDAIKLLNEYCYLQMQKSFPEAEVNVSIKSQEQVTLRDMSVPILTKLVHAAFIKASSSNFNVTNDVDPLTGVSLVTTARKFVTKYLDDNYSR